MLNSLLPGSSTRTRFHISHPISTIASVPAIVASEVTYARQIGKDLHLTVHAPDSGGPYPVMVLAGGGIPSTLAPDFARRGYVSVSLQCASSDAGCLAQSLAWIYVNIADYGGDSYYLHLLGCRQGAHASALLATDRRYLNAHGLGLDILHCVVLVNDASHIDGEDILYPICKEPMPPLLVLHGRVETERLACSLNKMARPLEVVHMPAFGFVL